jgi:SPP1 family predicted phage head-tail adaptor
MRAGKFDREILIESYTSVQDPGTGEEIPTWVPLATMRAEVIQSGADEFFQTGGIAGVVVVIFRTRYVGGVTVQSRVTFEERIFDLVEVKELGRRRGLELRGKAASE